MTCATLSLKFAANLGVTSFRAVRQDPPWRAVRAFSNVSGEALVHLHNVSGGVLGGDNLRLEVTLEPQAKAQITTVGATRIHRHRPGRPESSHANLFHVGAGALLEYLPDPVIPFACSRFSQHCDVHLSDDGGLIWWETVSAGRLAHGESFRFDSLTNRTAIHSPCGPIVLEQYSLFPKLQAMTSPSRMGKFLYSATMYVCRADSSPRWLSLENGLNEIAHELSGAETCWGVSSLVRDGVVVRGMTCRAHQVTLGLQRLWEAAKQSVWERSALPPRKIY